MQYVSFGQTDLTVSRIGLGMMSYGDPKVQRWALVQDDAKPIVRRAVEAGITFFDTADVCLDGVGEGMRAAGRPVERAVRAAFLLRGRLDRRPPRPCRRRPEGRPANDEADSVTSIDDQLQQLESEFINIYRIHWGDQEIPIGAVAALDEVVKAGKVEARRRIDDGGLAVCKGPTRRPNRRLAALCGDAEPLQPCQPRRGTRVIPLCTDQGVGVIPYSPLARGLLAGTLERTAQRHTVRAAAGEKPYRAADFDVVDAVRAVASRAYGVTSTGIRAGVAPRQASGRLANHRRDQTTTSDGRHRGTRANAQPRGHDATGSPLRPAPARRIHLSANREPH